MSMSKKPVQYYVVNAFTETAFKGNPAAVCLLEQEKDDKWLQALATEFNVPVTCYLIPLQGITSNPRFRLRWFTHILEVNICAHATLAASHALFSSGLVDNNVTIEFVTLSGILTAKKISMINGTSDLKNLQNGKSKEVLHIELDFPVDPITELKCDDTSLISEALNGASIVDIKSTHIQQDILVEVTSGKNVIEVQPNFDSIAKLHGRGIIVTGIAPPESEFDFYSRFFCPKYGVNEDPVCGSAHCGLASYWSKKLGKCDLKAYQASARGGILNLHIDDKKQRVILGGKAITVMKGCVLV